MLYQRGVISPCLQRKALQRFCCKCLGFIVVISRKNKLQFLVLEDIEEPKCTGYIVDFYFEHVILDPYKRYAI